MSGIYFQESNNTTEKRGIMQYTRYGWHDEENRQYVPYLLVERKADAGTCSYSLAMISTEDIEHCCTTARPAPESVPPTLSEIVMLLANISLGQRSTTPQGQSLFIDRYNKTFFQPSRPIAYELSQESVSRISSLANYIHVRRWDKTYGVIEPLYEEYLVICGNLAYTLLSACRRYLDNPDNELSCDVKSNKHNLCVHALSASAARRLAKSMTPETAARMVEGAMLSCAIRDHSEIQKDKANIRLRSSLSIYDDVPAYDMKASVQCKSGFGTKQFFDYLENLSNASLVQFYLVKSNHDEIVCFDEYAGYRTDKYDILPVFEKVA